MEFNKFLTIETGSSGQSPSHEMYLVYTISRYIKYTKIIIAIIYNCNIMLTLCVYNYCLGLYI